MAVDTDLVRILIGDIDGTLVDDEVITAFSAIYSDSYLVAAGAADYLAAKFSKSVTFSVEGLSIQNSTKAENYRELADRLRAQSGGGASGVPAGTPFVSGVSISEMDSVDSDTDRVPSRVSIGQDDNPGSADGPIHWWTGN
jgi:hypothetical protein